MARRPKSRCSKGTRFQDVFNEFIRQRGRFELGWVPIGTEGYAEYRYEEVVSVRVVLTTKPPRRLLE